MHKILLLAALLGGSASTWARPIEKTTAKNAVYLDILGVGGYYALSYERQILERNRFAMGARIGITSYEFRDFNDKFNPDLIVPLSINAYYGNVHHVELGIGPTLSSVVKAHPFKFTPTRDLLVNVHMQVGYRYQKPGGGFLFRIGYTPYIQAFRITHLQFIKPTSTLRHWGGISVGYTF